MANKKSSGSKSGDVTFEKNDANENVISSAASVNGALSVQPGVYQQTQQFWAKRGVVYSADECNEVCSRVIDFFRLLECWDKNTKD
jgi:hypothetical protein